MAAQVQPVSRPSNYWLYDASFGMYTFMPFGNLRSAYGYRYYAPGHVDRPAYGNNSGGYSGPGSSNPNGSSGNSNAGNTNPGNAGGGQIGGGGGGGNAAVAPAPYIPPPPPVVNPPVVEPTRTVAPLPAAEQ